MYNLQSARTLGESTFRNPLYGMGSCMHAASAMTKVTWSGRLHAIDALLAVTNDLPCTVKFLIEGEEEVSSLHLKITSAPIWRN